MTTRFSVSCLLAKSAQKAIDDRKCWLVVPGPAVGHRAIPDNGERDCASRNISVFETHAVICSVVFGFVHAGIQDHSHICSLRFGIRHGLMITGSNEVGIWTSGP